MTTITNEEIWEIKLEAVKTYIDGNNKWPSPSDKKLSVKLLGLWILDQTQEYGLLRDRGDKYPSHIMANPLIMDKWVKFSDNSRYDCSTDFTPRDRTWLNTFEKVKEFTDKNNRRPNIRDLEPEVNRLSWWIRKSQSNWVRKLHEMSNPKIYERWDQFDHWSHRELEMKIIDQEQWYSNLLEIEKYMDENSKRPSTTDPDRRVQLLAEWLIQQQLNYQNNPLMSCEAIAHIWGLFIKKPLYAKYLPNDEEQWENNLEKLKTFILVNNTRPYEGDFDPDVRSIYHWFISQDYQSPKPLLKEFVGNGFYKEYLPGDYELSRFRLKKLNPPVKKIEISREMLLNIAEMRKQCIQSQECEWSEVVEAVGKWLSKHGC
jgi:hypothetical protein